MSRLAYLTGRVVGLLVQPFIDGVLDGAFGMPDQDAPIVSTKPRDMPCFVPVDGERAA